MKRIFLISFLIVLYTASFAQFFDMRSNWSIIETNLFDDSYQVISAYKIDGDTIISDLVYGKVYCNNIYYCSLREYDGSIYAKFPEINSELLIYNFNWHPNDTLYHQVYYDIDSLYIQDILGETIDSIMLMDGRYYKCIRNFFGDITIINGIGDTHGFFFHTFELPPNGCQFSLLRFNIGENTIYCNPEYGNCNVDFIMPPLDNDAIFNVFPNPTAQVVTVEIYNDYFDTLYVYDIKGNPIASHFISGRKQIELTGLSRGEYIVVVSNNRQRLSTKLIIK